MGINDKIKGYDNIPLGYLQISEYNTRASFIDQQHVDFLASEIDSKGYHPNRALLVNILSDKKNNPIDYRVVAGVHRYKACVKINLSQIPCLIYKDLTPEEEVYLDKWDNEMDEAHKPFHFMEEVEQCKYLKEVKCWSTREIANALKISQTLVVFRLKIAFIPQKAKEIVLTDYPGNHFFHEKYFRDICKLHPDHITTICHEIYVTGKKISLNEINETGLPFHQMRQAEIKKRVQELLELQKQGKILRIDGIEDKYNSIQNEFKQAEIDFNFNFENIFEEWEGIEGYDIKPRRLGLGLLKRLTRSEKLVFDVIYAKTIGFKKRSDKIALSQFESLTNLKHKEIRTARDKLIEKNLIVCEGEKKDMRKYSLNPLLLDQIFDFITNKKIGVNKLNIGGKVRGKSIKDDSENPNTNSNEQISKNNNNNDVVAVLFNYGIKGNKLNECISKIDKMGGIEYLNEKVLFVTNYKPKNKECENPAGLLITAILNDIKPSNKIDNSQQNELFEDKNSKAKLNLFEQYEEYVDQQIDERLSDSVKNEIINKLFTKKIESSKLHSDKKQFYLENENILFHGLLRDDLKEYFSIIDFDKYCSEYLIDSLAIKE